MKEKADDERRARKKTKAEHKRRGSEGERVKWTGNQKIRR